MKRHPLAINVRRTRFNSLRNDKKKYITYLPIIRPTFGSQPAIAHLTRLEFVTNLPRSLAKISDGAPVTDTFNTCCVPSPDTMKELNSRKKNQNGDF